MNYFIYQFTCSSTEGAVTRTVEVLDGEGAVDGVRSEVGMQALKVVKAVDTVGDEDGLRAADKVGPGDGSRDVDETEAVAEDETRAVDEVGAADIGNETTCTCGKIPGWNGEYIPSGGYTSCC